MKADVKARLVGGSSSQWWNFMRKSVRLCEAERWSTRVSTAGPGRSYGSKTVRMLVRTAAGSHCIFDSVSARDSMYDALEERVVSLI